MFFSIMLELSSFQRDSFEMSLEIVANLFFVAKKDDSYVFFSFRLAKQKSSGIPGKTIFTLKEILKKRRIFYKECKF